VGDPVTWEYIVTNTGNVTLTDIVVEDTELGYIGTIPILNPGETTTLTATGVAIEGQYENTATVYAIYFPEFYDFEFDNFAHFRGEFYLEDGIYFEGIVVTDEDPSHYYGYLLASLGNYIWEDLDGDGIQDPGEPGIPGVTVNLYDSSDNLVATTVTDGNGYYEFTDLEPGDYYVEIIAPAGYFFTLRNAGSDTGLDSDPDPATGRTVAITLEPGENDLTWDAGLYRRASLGNFFWEDLDGDGIQDPGEPGIPGVTVNLYDSSDNLVATTVTDGSGYYEFTDLEPGKYYIEFVFDFSGDYQFYSYTSSNVGSDDEIDSDADPTTGKTNVITLLSGENDTSWDAGISVAVLPYTEKEKPVSRGETREVPEVLPYTGFDLVKYLLFFPVILVIFLAGLVLRRSRA
jgi:hypothetical protein